MIIHIKIIYYKARNMFNVIDTTYFVYIYNNKQPR